MREERAGVSARLDCCRPRDEGSVPACVPVSLSDILIGTTGFLFLHLTT